MYSSVRFGRVIYGFIPLRESHTAVRRVEAADDDCCQQLQRDTSSKLH